MREEFEKLPFIADKVGKTVQWSDKLEMYHAKEHDALCDVKFVAGAWKAYQIQQEKIEKLKRKAIMHGVKEEYVNCDRKP